MLLTPVLELNIPEYIREFVLKLALGSSSIKYALAPKLTDVLLNPPFILASSINQALLSCTIGVIVWL